MKVHGPDGRVWEVARRADPPRPLAALLPGGSWVVRAETAGEVRVWDAVSRKDAAQLAEEVAMALRTGGPSPRRERTGDLSATDGDDVS